MSSIIMDGITHQELSPFISDKVVFGNGKSKHFVLACHYFDDLANAIKYAQSVPQDDTSTIHLKTIKEHF